MSVAVVHFQPLEMYPPAINTLDIMAGSLPGVEVYTTVYAGMMEPYRNPAIQIRRYPFPNQKNSLSRLARYLLFNAAVFLHLLRTRPDKVLYYESYSAYPVYLYSRYVNRSAEILFHSHEYFYPEWWEKRAMKLLRYYYSRERAWLYPRAVWLSQTNEDRLRLFLEDIGMTGSPSGHIYPNYPPQKWIHRHRETGAAGPLQIVYVGSFASLELLYIREITEWIKSQKGAVELDVYSFVIPPKVREFLDTAACPYLHIKGPLDYRQMPEVLGKYRVGLILYKAASANVVYCAPNKLFEYLVCGLDVFYPRELIAIHPFDSSEQWPKVIPLDYTNLSDWNIFEAIDRSRCRDREITYTAEEASRELIARLGA